MINKPPPFKGFDIRIPIIIPIHGKGFINKGSTLGVEAEEFRGLGFGVCGLGF